MSGYQRQNGDIVEPTATGLEVVRGHKNSYADSTRPLAMDERRWSAWDMGSLWIGMLVSIAVYQVASGLIVSGMSWGEALFTIVLGYFLVMVFAVVPGHFGTKYGLTYPMFCEMVFGSKDIVVPSLVRGILGCFWSGVQVWIGGQAVNAILAAFFPSWNGLGFKRLFTSFLTFWLMNVYIAGFGSGVVQKPEEFIAPVSISLSFIAIIWEMYTADWSVSELLSEPSTQGNPDTSFWKLFFPALPSMIAFGGGIALFMADFTRNCKTQKAQTVGQLAGAPVATAFIIFVDIYGIAGVSLVLHETIREPAVLVNKFDNPATVIIFSLSITMVMLTTNVAANPVPSTNVLTTLFAKKISYKKAALIAAILAPSAQPWNALASAYDLIYSVCGLLGALLGPISGPYPISYLLEHKIHADTVDLYRKDGGRYYYKGGWDTAIIVIFLAATTATIAGKYITPLNFLFDNVHVTGSVGAGLLHYIYLKIQNKRDGVNENGEDNHQTRHDCVTK